MKNYPEIRCLLNMYMEMPWPQPNLLGTTQAASADFYRSISDIVVQLGYSGIDGSVTEGQKNELSYISQNIINMAANTKNIEQELVRKITQLKKSQAVALQTQLNPHFLFNTLNAVGLLYATDNPGGSDADILVRYLSDILDFSLNTKENIIPIRDEVFYTKRYIEIEKIKYQQDFCVIWDIDPALYDCKALKFILQPIVENAFEHGFRDDLGPGSRLEIAAAVQNSCLTFTVADNGHGMSPQRLEQIRGLLASDTLPESKNIGICNVSRRIQLVFGEQYGCSISSSPAGTTVQIRLPVI